MTEDLLCVNKIIKYREEQGNKYELNLPTSLVTNQH
jgi:hypothetical protein